MKHVIGLFLCAATVITVLGGCMSTIHNPNNTSLQQTIPTVAPTTQPTEPTEETTEQLPPINLLIIGNSHSIDAFHFLYQAFLDQQPDREITLGVLYYGSCSISKHVLFALQREAVYKYYKNTDGRWEIKNNMDMVSVLEDHPWDMVMLQAAKTDLDETLNEDSRRELEAFVSKHTSVTPQFLWHTSWPSPNDEAIFSADYINPPPDGYKENLMRLYGFDPINQFTVLTNMAKTHILPDIHYSQAICTGAAVMYAHSELSIPQQEIWRDYTHLSDFGRLIVAYAMYTQLTGNPISTIGLNTIPVQFRHPLFQDLGDLKVTKQMKGSIILSANYALRDPWTVLE